MRLAHLALTLAASAALVSPALAQDIPGAVTDAEGRVFGALPSMPQASMPQAAMRGVDTRPVWKDGRPAAAPAPYDPRGSYGANYARQRDQWLVECRRRMGDNGVGGAVIGGVIGGIAGNRIAGRHDRTVGTIAGAVVGAVAGAAIDKAEDRSRARDYCESYLDSYTPQQSGYGYGQQGHGYAPTYGYATMMVPVMMVPVQQHHAARPCTETIVTEEWVTVRERRHRHIAPRRVIRDKRVRMTPDKRLPM